jgi:hypothetical protein
VARVRLDIKATSISLLVVLGIRESGQKVLLAVKEMGAAGIRQIIMRKVDGWTTLSENPLLSSLTLIR